MSSARCSHSKEVSEEHTTLRKGWEDEGMEVALVQKSHSSTDTISARYYTQYLSVLLADNVNRADLLRENGTSTRTHSLKVDDNTNHQQLEEVDRSTTGKRSSISRDNSEAAFLHNYDNSINNSMLSSGKSSNRSRRQLLQSSYCHLPRSRYGTSQERLESFVMRNEKSSQGGDEGAFFGKPPRLPLAPPLIITPRTSTKSGRYAQGIAVDSQEEASLVLQQQTFPNLRTLSRSSPTPILPQMKAVLSSSPSSPATSVCVSSQLEGYAHAMRAFNLQKQEQAVQRRLALEEAAREFVQSLGKANGDNSMQQVEVMRTVSGSSKDAAGSRQGDMAGHANRASAATGECITQRGTNVKVGASFRCCPRPQSTGCLRLDDVAASHNNNTSNKEGDDGSRASCRVHDGGVGGLSATSGASSFASSRQHVYVPVPPKSQNFSSIPRMRNSLEIGTRSGHGTAHSPKDKSNSDGVNCSSIYCRSSRQAHADSPHNQTSSVPSSPSRQTNMVRSVEILSPRVRKALVTSTARTEPQTAIATTSRNSEYCARTTNRLTLIDPKARAASEEQTLKTRKDARGRGERTFEGAACDASKLLASNPAVPAEKEQYLDSLSTTPGTVKHNLRIRIAEEEKQNALKRSKWRRDAVRVHKLKLRIRNPLREQAIDRLAASAQGQPHVRALSSKDEPLPLACPTPPKSGRSHSARKSGRFRDDKLEHRNGSSLEVQGERCDNDDVCEISTERSDEHSQEVHVSLPTTVSIDLNESRTRTNEKCDRGLQESSENVIERMSGGEQKEGGQESEQEHSGIYAPVRDGGRGTTAVTTSARTDSDGMGKEDGAEDAGLEDDNTRPYSDSSSSIASLSKSTSDPPSDPAVSKKVDTEGSACDDDAENNSRDIDSTDNHQNYDDNKNDGGEYGDADDKNESSSPSCLNSSSSERAPLSVPYAEGDTYSYYHEKDGNGANQKSDDDDDTKRRRASRKDKTRPESPVDANNPPETEEAISLEELHGSAAYL